MKNKGLKYKDLALKLNLSESSIKRLMSQGEITLSQLTNISEWLGLETMDLLKISGQNELRVIPCTDQQDHAFAENPVLLYLYIRLMAGDTVEGFARKYNLTVPAVLKYTFELERLQLIQVLPDNGVRILKRGILFHKRNGQFLEKYAQKLAKIIYERFNYSQKDQQSSWPKNLTYGLSFYEFYLTHKSAEEFVRELEQVIVKYASLSGAETTFEKFEELVPMSGSVFASQFNLKEAVFIESLK